MREEIITLYRKPKFDRFGKLVVDIEEYLNPQWVTIARLVRCPGNCEGGEQWGGDQLVECHVCFGSGMVQVGIGGARLARSWEYQIEDIPDETFYAAELDRFLWMIDIDEPWND